MSDKAHKALTSLSDGELIGLAQEGSRAAFEGLFHRHQDRVYTIALSITRNQADAKDVVQDTFIKTYTRVKRLDAEGAVLAYLLKTAANTAIDTIRKRSAHKAVSIDVHNAPPMPGLHTPQTRLESAAKAQHLLDAILELSEHHRVVIALHHIEGLTIDKIARRLQIPEGTVKSRLGRAREILRRKLQGKVL